MFSIWLTWRNGTSVKQGFRRFPLTSKRLWICVCWTSRGTAWQRSLSRSVRITSDPCKTSQESLQTSNIQSVSFITGKLISLRELNVSYNKLSSIPPELGDCENLERLEMTANFNLEELPFEVKKSKDAAKRLNTWMNLCVIILKASNEFCRQV